MEPIKPKASEFLTRFTNEEGITFTREFESLDEVEKFIKERPQYKIFIYHLMAW